ncbi:hypothetical protein COHCIP112018_05208 [Cohnella sp. JJ-181]|nr:hypothetical protein COHCIP112018_05208 [Cohnella sp. JJ-181]
MLFYWFVVLGSAPTFYTWEEFVATYEWGWRGAALYGFLYYLYQKFRLNWAYDSR